MTRNRWINGSVGVGMLALFAASCDNAERDAITPDEARAIAQVIVGASQSAGGQFGGAVPPNDLAAGGADVEVGEYDITLNCSEGGTVNLKGTIEEDEEVGYFKQEGINTFDNCAEKTEDGETITLTEGSIDGVLLLVRVDGSSSRLDGSWSGNVSWESDDGGSGKCEVDLTAEATFRIDPGTGNVVGVNGRVKGTICGVSLDEDFA